MVTNMSNNSSQHIGPGEDPGREVMAYYVSGLVLHSLSIILNIIVVIVIVLNRRLRTKPNVFVGSLSASGVLHGCCGCVFTIKALHSPSPVALTEGLHLYLFFWQSAVTSNYLNVVAVALERWMFIAKPFLYRRYISRKVVIGAALLLWGISIVVNMDQTVLPFISPDATVQVAEAYRIKCLYLFPVAHTLWVCFLCLSCSHLVFISSKQLKSIQVQRQQIGTIATIAEEVYYYNKNITSSHTANKGNGSDAKSNGGWVTRKYLPSATGGKNPRRALFKRNWKSVKMFLSVFGTFFLTLSPWVYYNIYSMTNSINFGGHTDQLRNMLVRFADVHYCCIFFVYSLQNKEFRNAYKTMVRLAHCRSASVAPSG